MIKEYRKRSGNKRAEAQLPLPYMHYLTPSACAYSCSCSYGRTPAAAAGSSPRRGRRRLSPFLRTCCCNWRRARRSGEQDVYEALDLTAVDDALLARIEWVACAAHIRAISGTVLP